jgi:hypothetical protein
MSGCTVDGEESVPDAERIALEELEKILDTAPSTG